MSISRLKILTLFIVLVSASSFATLCSAETVAPPMLTVDIDKQDISDTAFNDIDLKKTFVQLASTTTNDTTTKRMEKALHLLARHAIGVTIINGIAIDSAQPLSEATVHDIADLAKKSVFLSSRFTFQNPADWSTIFSAERDNSQLLSTFYGENTMAQIMASTILAPGFANTGVAFTHVFTPSHPQAASTRAFWMAVAKTCQANKRAFSVISLSGNDTDNIDFDAILREPLLASGGYLIWVGNHNQTQINPIERREKTLVIWRQADGVLKSYPYQRKYSPHGLYLALGINKPGFDLVKTLAKRAQNAASHDISLLGDAENNIHTYAVLLDFANTTIAENATAFVPPQLNPVIQSKLNIALLNPTSKSLEKILQHENALRESITANQYVGIFDYSKNTNAAIYLQLGQLLTNTHITHLAYNTSTKTNLDHLLAMSKKFNITDVYLGPDASLIYLGDSQQHITLNSNVTVHTFESTLKG